MRNLIEHRVGRGRRLPVTQGRRELALFGGIYLLYDAARWVFAGQLPVARAHAHWIIDLERSLHITIESTVQHAFSWGAASFVLANVYLAAQLIVLPGSLIWLYRPPHRPTGSFATPSRARG